MNRTKFAFYVALSSLMFACSDSSVPDPKLVAVYSDVIIIRETYSDSTLVRTKNDSVLKANGYDSTSFANELRSMSNTPQLFKSFYDSVSTTISRKRTSLNK